MKFKRSAESKVATFMTSNEKTILILQWVTTSKEIQTILK